MIIQSEFRPLWWLGNAHLQTLWPVFFRRLQNPPLRVERLDLPDGDFLDLAWAGGPGPLVLILHGLEGSLGSHYAGLIGRLAKAGFQVVFMHFRGCSGEPNRLDRAYHSGETGDLDQVVRHLRARSGKTLHAAVGFSLGGNVLLKWLGEQGASAPLETAVAVSVPYRLADSARRLGHGMSRLYQAHLIRRLHASYRRKFSRRSSPLDVDLEMTRDFWSFDDQVTAPLHGFRDVHHYYAASSSRQFLKDIRVPTLLIHALDDPFMFPETVPDESELSPPVVLELSRRGGHVGFVGGRLLPEYWLEQRILDYLNSAPAGVPKTTPAQGGG
ncbi:MAG: hydrolase [Pseudomonadota bacterium]